MRQKLTHIDSKGKANMVDVGHKPVQERTAVAPGKILLNPDRLKRYPNMLLIAGTGRNVGKTMLACRIIGHLSKTTDVTGVKVSPHFHPVEEKQTLIAKTTRYRVTEETKETLHTGKDSSRMLKAGAVRVFYIQAEESDLGEAFNAIAAEIKVGPVICESGGMHEYIKPGLFLFVRGKEIPETKKSILDFNPVIMGFAGGIADIDISDIYFKDNRFCYTSQIKQQLNNHDSV